jgi:hypothetical protein
MPVPVLYVLEIQCHGLATDISVNDISVTRARSGTGRTLQLKLTPWLTEGTSQIDAILRPVPTDPSLPPGAAPAFRLRVIRGVLGQEPGPDGELVRYVWDAEVEPLGPRGVRWSGTIPVTDEVGPWTWQSAPAGGPTDDDVAAILDLARTLHSAAERRDVETIVELHRVRNEEMGGALGVPGEQLAEEQAVALRGLMDTDGWEVAPLDLDALTLDPQAGGRIVAVHGPGDFPPVIGRSGERTIAFRFSASLVGGAWTIVR